jgi:hypothetical protein
MSSGESESQQGEYAVQSDTGVDAGVPDDRGETLGEPDVVLDIPVLNVEEGTLQVEELELRVSFRAELADLVKINIGVEAEVEGVELEVKGVEVQAQPGPTEGPPGQRARDLQRCTTGHRTQSAVL